MQILHLIRVDAIGGAEKVILNGIPALREQGVDARVALLDPFHSKQNPILLQLQKLKIPYDRIVDSGRPSIKRIGEVAALLKKHQVDLLHVHGYRAAFYGFPASKQKKIPITITRHGMLSRNRKEKLVEWLELKLSNRMSGVIGVAPQLLEGVTTRAFLIRNGIPIPPEDLCASLQDYGTRLLFVGRLSPEKRPQWLLEAFALALKQNPALRLDILGTGSEESALQQKIQSMGLSKQVKMHGFQHPEHFYQKTDLLLMTSRTEGLPLVALEAMAARVPVLSTAVGDLPFLLQENKSPERGFLAPVNSIQEYVSILLEASSQTGRLQSAGMAARTFIQEHYSIKSWAETHKQLYRELIASASTTST